MQMSAQGDAEGMFHRAPKAMGAYILKTG